VSAIPPNMAKAAVQEAAGDVATVDVRVVWDPPWDPGMMDGAAAAALGFRS
jgi:metal-sulfur cluster biosynthetic enzyme